MQGNVAPTAKGIYTHSTTDEGCAERTRYDAMGVVYLTFAMTVPYNVTSGGQISFDGTRKFCRGYTDIINSVDP